MQNIVAVLFDVESEGYQAITNLKKDPRHENYAILQMALVKKEGGRITILDNYDSGIDTKDDMAKGGIIGGLLGILGGPVGVLLMGAYGALAGGLLDIGDALSDSTLIGAVGSKLGDGTTALVALVNEENESVLDTILQSQFKVEIYRYDAAVIAAEVDEAAEMSLELQRQALMKLRHENKEVFKQKVEAKREKLSDRFDQYIEKAVEAKREELDL